MGKLARKFQRGLLKEDKAMVQVKFGDGTQRTVIMGLDTVDGKRKAREPKSVVDVLGKRHQVDIYGNDLYSGEKVYERKDDSKK